MGSLVITHPAPRRPAAKLPKATLIPEDGPVFTLPYAPRGTSLGGWAKTFSQQDRPGRKPLNTLDGGTLETLSFDVFLGYRDHQTSVEPLLGALERLAGSGKRITIAGLSPRERGPWRLTDASVSGDTRQQGTNAITRATVSLTFTEASDANPKLGPVHGGKKTTKTVKKAKKYTIKKGDTLKKIATKFYGSPDGWKAIAKANKIKTPDKLKVGSVITIPPTNAKAKGPTFQLAKTFVLTGSA